MGNILKPEMCIFKIIGVSDEIGGCWQKDISTLNICWSKQNGFRQNCNLMKVGKNGVLSRDLYCSDDGKTPKYQQMIILNK